jgi:WXXGXW repeat (2 copies)
MDDRAEGNTMRIIIRSLLLILGILAISAASLAQVRVGVAITIAPPILPVYEQPICPGDGYIWTPGYWAYGDDDGYFWVPGTWVLAPEVGFLWTPGYWGWGDGEYIFYEGYWGPQIGFYGGINYGFGYFGHGFEGGRWENGHFFYNRAVSNVNVTVIHNVYDTSVSNTSVTRVSYNGGNGGINERPTAQEEAAAHQRHIPPVASQTQHVQAARGNPELRASANHGNPPIAATAKPGEFKGGEVASAKGGETVHESPARPENNAARPNPAIHARDLPQAERPAPPNTGDAKKDQKYQQQQQKLTTKQDQERQKLQQQQDKDHRRLEQQKANDAKKQQVEKQHQQQTQQLAQRHAQQQQQLQQHQQPAAHAAAPSARPPKA